MKFARVFCAAVFAFSASGARPKESFASLPKSMVAVEPVLLQREIAAGADEHRLFSKDENVASLAHETPDEVPSTTVSHVLLLPHEPQESSVRPVRLRGGGGHSLRNSLLQRSVRHTRRHRHWRQDPLDTAEGEMIMGMPKLVWVILMDVVAMSLFLSCIPTVMYLGKQRRPDFDSPPGCCDCLFGSKNDQMERMGV